MASVLSDNEDSLLCYLGHGGSSVVSVDLSSERCSDLVCDFHFVADPEFCSCGRAWIRYSPWASFLRTRGLESLEDFLFLDLECFKLVYQFVDARV